MKGKYILTITARRKNARRHIVQRSDDLEKLRAFRSDLYLVRIYDSRWNLIETVKQTREV